MNGKPGIHEIYEVHELLGFKTTCLNKARNYVGMVSDNDLRNLIQQDINSGTKCVSELSNILSKGQNW